MKLRKPKSIRFVAIVAVAIVLALLIGAIVQMGRKNDELSAQLEKLRASDKQSFIVRQISRQMEEIAQGQKEISDKRRMEAEAQTVIAENMRMRADDERRNALIAEGQAIEASKVARKEQREANEQRKIAEASRNQAVAEKNRADTLAYIALGRSLAIKSTFQYNAGNLNIARMLAYYSWLYTTRYNGNIYDGVIYASLYNFSKLLKLQVSKAALTSMVADNNAVYICTKYGEVKTYRTLTSKSEKIIFSDKSFDFRDGLLDSKKHYWALDVNGRLLKLTPQKQIITLTGSKFFRLLTLGKSFLCAISQTSIYIIPINDPTKAKLIATGSYTAAGKHGEKADVATSTGSILTINEYGKIGNTSKNLNIGKITAIEWSSSGRGAYGNAKGEITIVDESDHKLLTIKAHKSAISRLRLKDGQICSAGYDGYIYLWNIRSDKYESTTLASESVWVRSISRAGSYLYYLLESGQLGRININPDDMIKRIRKQIKGDMSHQDWNYYIGSQIPYEKI